MSFPHGRILLFYALLWIVFLPRSLLLSFNSFLSPRLLPVTPRVQQNKWFPSFSYQRIFQRTVRISFTKAQMDDHVESA
uniref:Uncharacterized protein n=1 Tax=Anopheles braziliensis TaxID=58242 RepID=A0A2M3ZM95_9DIPT